MTGRKRKFPSEAASPCSDSTDSTDHLSRISHDELQHLTSCHPLVSPSDPNEWQEDTLQASTQITKVDDEAAAAAERKIDHECFCFELSYFLKQEKFESDELGCCEHFLSSDRYLRLLEYNEYVGIDKFAGIMKKCLVRAEIEISKLKEMVLKSCPQSVDSYVDELWRTDEISHQFIECILWKTNWKPTLQEIDDIVTNWNAELDETLYYYNSDAISNDEMRQKYHEIMREAKLCRNEEYLDLVYKLLLHIESCDQDVYPFIFLCASHGTGKSMLAYNLANHKCPLFYFLFEDIWDDYTQDTYRPFKLVTQALHSGLWEDLKALMGNIRDHKLASINALSSEENMNRPFKTVHFFIMIFTRLITIQADNSDCEQGWMDALLSIDRLERGELSLKDGIEAIKLLKRSKGLQSEPLVAVLDKSILERYGYLTNQAAAEMSFLRNVCRILKIIPILCAKDARSIYLCDKDFDCVRNPIWAVLLSDLPPFDSEVLKTLCSQVKNANHPNVKPILDFLQSIPTYENPGLIQSIIDRLNHLHSETVNSLSTGELLNEVLSSLQYNMSAFGPYMKTLWYYATSRQLHDGSLKVSHHDDFCAYYHRANLRITPSESGSPFCYLTLTKSNIEGACDVPTFLATDSSHNVTFKSRGVFTLFKDAPLTGLVSFGLFKSRSAGYIMRPPFLLNHDRASSLDAAICTGWNKKSVQSGRFFGDLYTLATLVASRANGPSGCSFAEFLRCLILEFISARKNGPEWVADSKWVHEKLPTIDFGPFKEHFERKMIPLLSPMTVSNWSAPTIALMRSASEKGECQLGTFLYSSSNSTVDHIVVEFDYSTDSAPSSMEKKVFNNFTDVEQLDFDAIKSIPLMAECSTCYTDLTLLDIHNVIEEKFNLLNTGLTIPNPIPELKDCKTFIILALSVSEDLEQKDQKYLHNINQNGFHLWFFKNTFMESERNPLQVQRSLDYFLEPLKGQTQSNSKDIIIVPLSEIVGRKFTELLLSKAPEAHSDDEEEEWSPTAKLEMALQRGTDLYLSSL